MVTGCAVDMRLSLLQLEDARGWRCLISTFDFFSEEY